MPYVFRDASGAILRASVRPVIGAEMLPYDHPDLVAFLEKHGQSQEKIETSLAELRRTDPEMSRAVEDVIMALLKKNVLKMTDLPKPVQERMALRVKLRVMIQDAYDQASGQSSAAQALSLPPSTTDV
jgi:hypothetical protein